MIHYLKIKNFRSIKEEVTLSFEATLERNLRHLYVREQAGLKLLRLGILYGANASGKSNILLAFNFLKDFMLRVNIDKNRNINRQPFLFDNATKNEPTCFELSFIIDESRYKYELCLDDSKVISEVLYQYKSQKPSLIFNRTFKDGKTDVKFSDKLNLSSIAKNKIILNCLQNTSVLAAYTTLNANETTLESITHWLKFSFKNPINSYINLTNFAFDFLMQNPFHKTEIISELQKADFNICDLAFLERDMPQEAVDYLFNIAKMENKNITKADILKTSKTKELRFTHNILDKDGNINAFEMNYEDESDGTIRMLGFSVILKLLSVDNTFITIDEIESSMHPKLAEFLIQEFLNLNVNSQMLVATHYDGFLDEKDLIRNDVVWFTNKLKNGVSELYSLSDFKGLNRLSSIRKSYRAGNFYAQPNL